MQLAGLEANYNLSIPNRIAAYPSQAHGLLV